MQQVLVLVSKEFLWLVVIAFVISVPLTYWAMHHWLQSYAYRIHISVGVFAIAGGAALLIALITVSFQSIKAALSNSIKALRTE